MLFISVNKKNLIEMGNLFFFSIFFIRNFSKVPNKDYLVANYDALSVNNDYQKRSLKITMNDDI